MTDAVNGDDCKLIDFPSDLGGGLKRTLPWSEFPLPLGFLSLQNPKIYPSHSRVCFADCFVSAWSSAHRGHYIKRGTLQNEGTPGVVWTWSACPASVPRWHRATWVPVLRDTAPRRVSPICTEHTKEPLRQCRSRKESATSCNQEWMSAGLCNATLWEGAAINKPHDTQWRYQYICMR